MLLSNQCHSHLTNSSKIEVVPFFHKMAFTIINRLGEDNPKGVC